jgi:hypothetical protein
MRRDDPVFVNLLNAKRKLVNQYMQLWKEGNVLALKKTSTPAAIDRAGAQILAVGIGRKITAGMIQPEMAIRVYVVQKVDQADGLTPAKPGFIPQEVDGVPTDVIEASPAFLAPVAAPPIRTAPVAPQTPVNASVACSPDRQEAQRVLVGGISTSRNGGHSGTIACLCRSTKAGEGGLTLVLSNSHIYGPLGEGSDQIVQPASGDTPPITVIGTFLREVPVDFNRGAVNRVDAAVGSLLPAIQPAGPNNQNGRAFSPEVCFTGRVQKSLLASEEMPVMMHARTSGPSHGTVDDLHYTGPCGVDPEDPERMALFDGQLRIRAANGVFAQQGDSGALIVAENDRSKAVGLLFAKSENGDFGLANYIDDVLGALSLELL